MRPSSQTNLTKNRMDFPRTDVNSNVGGKKSKSLNSIAYKRDRNNTLVSIERCKLPWWQRFAH